jgi:hypothetical protein
VNSTVVHALPLDHALVADALYRAAIAGVEAAHALAATGQDIWLSWNETVPPHGPGQEPFPGSLCISAWWQARDVDPATGSQAGTYFKTARRYEIVLDDGRVLSVPVWRHGRRDTPHTPICNSTCADCGTGEYWLLPGYVWPDYVPGLADPADTRRLSRHAQGLFALGVRRVQWTDHARYARGMTGSPQQQQAGVLTSWERKPRADHLTVSWDSAGTDRLVLPDQVEHVPG